MLAYEEEGRDRYRDQIVTCDVGVSLHDVIMMSLGLYTNVWLGLIIIGTQVVEGLT